MFRAPIVVCLALCAAGCDLARTTVPYKPLPSSPDEAWSEARAACARDARLPVMRYEHTVLTQQTTFRCEALQGAAPDAR